jgi:hypothetical protein
MTGSWEPRYTSGRLSRYISVARTSDAPQPAGLGVVQNDWMAGAQRLLCWTIVRARSAKLRDDVCRVDRFKAHT